MKNVKAIFPCGEEFEMPYPKGFENEEEGMRLHVILEALKGPLGRKYHVTKRRWSAEISDFTGNVHGPCLAHYVWGHIVDDENTISISNVMQFKIES